MKPRFEHHYLSLLQDLCHLKRKGYPYAKELEGCFRLAYTCWIRVRATVLQTGFGDTREEIHFFKHVKPLFTAQMAYYTLLYHGELFQPDFCARALHRFWLRESTRLFSFLETNRPFVAYYKSGATDRDETYFRWSRHEDALSQGSPADPDRAVASPGDDRVATLLSLERYHAHVQVVLSRKAPQSITLAPYLPRTVMPGRRDEAPEHHRCPATWNR